MWLLIIDLLVPKWLPAVAIVNEFDADRAIVIAAGVIGFPVFGRARDNFSRAVNNIVDTQ